MKHKAKILGHEGFVTGTLESSAKDGFNDMIKDNFGNLEYISVTTIEPILDFDLKEFVELIKICNPKQVNIGADSGHNKLPEPSKEKVKELISELQKFTIIHNKSNLARLL